MCILLKIINLEEASATTAEAFFIRSKRRVAQEFPREPFISL